LIMLFVFIQIY